MAGAGVQVPAQAAAGPAVEVEGELLRLLYGEDGGDSSDSRGFAVWVVRTQVGEVRAAAELAPEAWGEPGDRVVLAGRWVEHPRHGRQLAVESIRPAPVRGAAGVIRWLARHRGIGEATARQVVDKLGPEALDRLCQDPNLAWRLGLPEMRVEALLRAVRVYAEHRAKVPVLVWAHQYGFGPAQAEAIWRGFGEQAPRILTRDPWRLVELEGFGFLRADELARRLGVDPSAPARLQAALAYALLQAAQDEGHVYLLERELLTRARALLNEVAQKTGYGARDNPSDWLVRALETAVQERKLLAQPGDRVYLPRLWQAETRVREWLQRRQQADRGLVDMPTAARLSQDVATRLGLDPVQGSAVTLALSTSASVLTGGPGTGKTTTVRAVLEALRRLGYGDTALLAAPTGRAAKRLAEVTGRNAVTLHRLLDFGPLPEGGFGPRRDAANPLLGTFLVVDECSMVDIELFAHLVQAVPEEMPVLLVGDADQLPPVGPGAPFHAVVQHGLLPAVVLERIYRQGEGSAIPHAARMVNNGRAPEPGERPGLLIRVYPRPPQRLPPDQREEQARRLRERMAADVISAVQELCSRHGFAPEEVQVLVPMRRGVLGVEELNLRLREVLNPSGRERGTFSLGGREFWLGDRVIQTRNNYDKGEGGVMNGEQGVVVSTTAHVTVTDRWGNETIKPAMLVRFEDGREVPYWVGDGRQLALAYALTVHKAQGSEYPAVVLALGWDSYLLLERPLVYTGMTRASRRLVVLAEDGVLQHAARTTSGTQRHQWLDG